MGAVTVERDEAIRELTRHCGDGRLTLDELEDRIQEVYAAETEEDIRHALRELPVSPAPTPPSPEREPPRAATPAPPAPPALPAEPDPEWQKAVGTLCCIGGFVLLFNGMFWLALICWFVVPGLIIQKRMG
jgi:hypothetical protein